MLPKTGNILRREFVIRKQPSRTYCLKDGRLQGCVDGREAVQQLELRCGVDQSAGKTHEVSQVKN